MTVAKLDYAILQKAIEGDPSDRLTLRAQESVLHKIVTVVALVLGKGRPSIEHDHPDINAVASLVLEVVWEKFDGFRPTNEKDPSRTASAATWVGRIAWLTAVAWQRQERRRHIATVPFEDEEHVGHSSDCHEHIEELRARDAFEEAMASSEVEQLLDRLVQRLSDEQRAVLVAHAYVGLSVPNIARGLQLDKKRVKARLRRTYDKLRRLVANPPPDLRASVMRLRDLNALANGRHPTALHPANRTADQGLHEHNRREMADEPPRRLRASL